MDILENIKFFLRLYYKPLSAMSGIIDRGNWLVSAVLAIAVSLLFQFGVGAQAYASFKELAARIEQTGVRRSPAQQSATQQGASQQSADPEPADSDPDDDEAPVLNRRAGRLDPQPIMGRFGWKLISPPSAIGDVLGLALLYVPSTILVMVLLGQQGSFAVLFRRDYGSLLTCTLMAWATSHLPPAILGLGLAPPRMALPGRLAVWLGIWVAGDLGFAVLMVCALRTVFGASFGRAIATVSVSWLPTLAEPFLLSSGLIYYLASPFLLFYLYQYLRRELGDIGLGISRRQGYRRQLEYATVNPHDAEAHYQLGLIYQHRHQYSEAIERFKRAVEIDPRETDAQYQLGILARSQGRLQEAIDYFSAVVALDDKHALSEVWREIGATYLAASMFDDALSALERFIDRRAYDAQGLYLIGEVLQKLNQPQRAREMYERCIEAGKTTPYYRRGEVRQWIRLAQKQARTTGVAAPVSSAE